jgi:RHS repeat-associated protein
VDQILAHEQVTSTSSAGNVLWPLGDNLGTVRDLADYNAGTDTTTVSNHRTYNSFGNITSESNSTIEHCFTYTSRELDKETGDLHYRARSLSASIARFLSEDPIRDDFRLLTRYAVNNPTNATDPSGLKDEGFEKEVNDDGTTTITIRSQCVIILLYGHGSKDKPHIFRFRNSLQAGCFVGCGAGTTNELVDQDFRISGCMMGKHDIFIAPSPPNGDKTLWRKYWWEKAMDGAKQKAKEWLTKYPSQCKQVRIIPIVAGSYKDSFTQPVEEEVVVTR